MIKKNLVHIGIHKSGSSFLQAKIFPKIKNFTNLGFYEKNLFTDDIRYFQTCSELYFDEKKITNLINFFKKFSNENKKLLISSEAFTGNISTQSFGTGIFIEMLAKRIKKYIPDAKIILILRNQKDAIYSLYKDDIQYGYTCNFNDWIKERLKTNSLDYFKYDKLILFYQNLFGKENLHTFLYEDIFKNFNEVQLFLNELDIEIDLTESDIKNLMNSEKINSSNSSTITNFTRVLNRFIKTKLSQSYTDGKYNLPVYNFWRYFLSKKLSIFVKKNSMPSSESFNLFLKDLDNDNLFKILNKKFNEKYFF